MPRRYRPVLLVLLILLLAVGYFLFQAPVASRLALRAEVTDPRPCAPAVTQPDLAASVANTHSIPEAGSSTDTIPQSQIELVRRPLPTWDPLPSPPAMTLRPCRGSDFGYRDERELDAIRNAVSVHRFQVTVSGTVTPVPDKPVRIWAENLPGFEMDSYHEDKVLELAARGRYWPHANPTGETTTDALGAFTLRLSVTGAEHAGLAAASGWTGNNGAGGYMARALLRARNEETFSLGVPLRRLTESQDVVDLEVPLVRPPYLSMRFTHDNGTPAAGAVVGFFFGQPSHGILTGLLAYADEQGRVSIPYQADVDLTLTVWTSQGTHHVVQGKRLEPTTERLIVLADRRQPGVILLQFDMEDGDDQSALDLSIAPQWSGPPNQGVRGPTKLAGTKWWAITGEFQGGDVYSFWFPRSGAVTVVLPHIGTDTTLELAPVVLPKPRVTRLTVLDGEKRPIADACLTARAYRGPTRRTSMSTEEGTSDSWGDVDLEVLPGREYELTLTHPDRGELVIPSIRFDSAGPKEIVWTAR